MARSVPLATTHDLTHRPPSSPAAPAPAPAKLSPADANHASVWIAKARDLELLGWWQGALACFNEGKSRGAHPIEMLEREFEAFVQRMKLNGLFFNVMLSYFG